MLFRSVLARTEPRLQFLEANVTSPDFVIPPETNLIVSQSSIEHMDSDLSFFARVRSYLDSFDGPVLQVHLCPSAACLRTYLRHGVRQYTPRTLSHITRMFPAGTPLLFGLGGAACNQLHFDFITVPLALGRGDQRLVRAAEYDARLRAAIARDMTQPDRNPAFWALVIQRAPRVPIF